MRNPTNLSFKKTKPGADDQRGVLLILLLEKLNCERVAGIEPASSPWKGEVPQESV